MINWKWFIVEGILLILLGIFAIARPGIAAEAIVELFGWLLIFLGVISFIGGVTSQSGPRKPVSFPLERRPAPGWRPVRYIERSPNERLPAPFAGLVGRV